MICPSCGAREKHADFTDCLASLRSRVETLEARLDRAEKRAKREKKETKSWSTR